MKLYDYYRSTACYRVRIALNLKQIRYEKIEIHLINQGGEQHHPDYLKLNPQGLVPTLDENGHIIGQSLAIIEYLDELHPTPPLLPKTLLARAHVRQLALLLACDVHPLNNLRTTNRLRSQFEANDEQVQDWYFHWLKLGFDAFETQLRALPHKGPVCYGDEVTLADICLVPQVFNAHRFGFAMDDYPLINEINAHCLTLAQFIDAKPSVDQQASL
ncbi:MAG: maleylacetoacetate isomerase [Legionellales bacterium RIFCSPHIGHO2_12_FULL_42_9]|nr:MAG: maleylacetoacetate isomerase [Legionellales bacterium RIFCSPHIGHO2_12_FULL_42_9]